MSGVIRRRSDFSMTQIGEVHRRRPRTLGVVSLSTCRQTQGCLRRYPRISLGLSSTVLHFTSYEWPSRTTVQIGRAHGSLSIG